MKRKTIKDKRINIVEDIIESNDAARMEIDGGYPSAYDFIDVDGKIYVIIASVYANEPELMIKDVDEFIQEYLLEDE